MAQIVRTFNPGVAALLSLIIPGAGQMYKGQVFNGLAWLFFVVCGYLAFVVPGVILHLCCIVGAASGNKAAAPVVETGPTPETHVRCPDCREYVYKDATVCKHCRCKLIPQ